MVILLLFLVASSKQCVLFQPVKENELGTVNNVLEVKKSDFEVFEALAYDSTGNSVVKGTIDVTSGFCNLPLLSVGDFLIKNLCKQLQELNKPGH